MKCWLSIDTVGINSVILLDSTVHTGNDFHQRIVTEGQSNAGSLDVTLLQIHSRGGSTIWTLRYS